MKGLEDLSIKLKNFSFDDVLKRDKSVSIHQNIRKSLQQRSIRHKMI